jgi:hypothetical protein
MRWGSVVAARIGLDGLRVHANVMYREIPTVMNATCLCVVVVEPLPVAGREQGGVHQFGLDGRHGDGLEVAVPALGVCECGCILHRVSGVGTGGGYVYVCVCVYSVQRMCARVRRTNHTHPHTHTRTHMHTRLPPPHAHTHTHTHTHTRHAPHAAEVVGGGRLVADDERLDADPEAPVGVVAGLVRCHHPCRAHESVSVCVRMCVCVHVNVNSIRPCIDRLKSVRRRPNVRRIHHHTWDEPLLVWALLVRDALRALVHVQEGAHTMPCFNAVSVVG